MVAGIGDCKGGLVARALLVLYVCGRGLVGGGFVLAVGGALGVVGCAAEVGGGQGLRGGGHCGWLFGRLRSVVGRLKRVEVVWFRRGCAGRGRVVRRWWRGSR